MNIEGTLNVLLAARDEGIRRVVYSSSSSVYGPRRELPVGEDLPPDPISPYGVAKLAAERYCVSFSRVYESFESVVVRYFNVFGPHQSPFSQYAAVIPLFVTAISAGEPITIFGDGEQRRDFTYVTNAVDGTIRAAEAARRERQDLQRRCKRAGRVSTTSQRRSGACSANRSRRSSNHRGSATSATRGRTSRRPASCSAGSRQSGWKKGCAGPSKLLSEQTRILRVIARLNVGGPALHVSYLTKGLANRGYDTTLVAGKLARGEDSMSYVADALGLDVRPLAAMHREVSPVYDPIAVTRLVGEIRRFGRTSCTPTRRRRGRSAGWLRCSRVTRGHRSSCTPTTGTC